MFINYVHKGCENMNKKTGLFVIVVGIGLFVLPSVFSQAPDEYRAYAYMPNSLNLADGTNVTGFSGVYYVPKVSGSPTYTFSFQIIPVRFDLDKPTTVISSIAKNVSDYGAERGWIVTEVFLPDIKKVIP